jgi:hypothetical protein
MSEYRTFITMGEDYARIYAAADAALDPAEVRATADRIIEMYRALFADPGNRAEGEFSVPLRRIRAALDDAREYVDAALRWLDTQPPDLPLVELVYLEDPTPADMAAAVFIAIPGEDEAYMVNLVSLDPA